MPLRVVLFALIGIAYPFTVYFGLTVLPPLSLGAILLAMMLARLLWQRASGGFGILGAALGSATAAYAILLVLDADVAVKAYPVLVSAGFAIVFGVSLWRPPTIIERFARLREPDLPAHALPYIRKVTIVWVAFFVANGSISAATGLWGTLPQWTWYNGFLSYVLTGALFCGEHAVRRVVRNRALAEPSS